MSNHMPQPIVIVIGGGPAGLMAAGTAASCGAKVLLFEKNALFGRKLLLTGSGKCNITNSAPLDLFLDQFAENRKFLYPAFRLFFREELEAFFRLRHVAFQTEENGKIFPVTKSAGSILDALLDFCNENGVEMYPGEPVLSIGNSSDWTVTTARGEYRAGSVILATGGLSYPKTGSTGDGYRFAQSCAHTVVPTRPALVALETRDSWSAALSGTSLRDIKVSLWMEHAGQGARKIADSQGDLLFTHFGLSGPPVLFLSRWLPDRFESGDPSRIFSIAADCFPSRSAEDLEAALLAHCAASPLRLMKTILSREFGLPLAMAAALAAHLGFGEDITGQDLTKEKRKILLKAMKDLRFPLQRSRGYAEAMVTAGGISTKEIRPQTMESKMASHLYFAGECIDIDGFTGGFNLQAALSTGYLAGRCASQ